MSINMTLIGQSITFLILVWFTMQFVWPKLMSVLDERAKKIAEGLASAERGRYELQRANQEAEEILRQAKDDVKKLLEQAHKKYQAIVDEAAMVSEKERQNILQETKEEVLQLHRRAEKEMHKRTGEMAIMIAEKILSKNFDAKSQKQIMDDFIGNL